MLLLKNNSFVIQKWQKVGSRMDKLKIQTKMNENETGSSIKLMKFNIKTRMLFQLREKKNLINKWM
jgi:hypothetical protein